MHMSSPALDLAIVWDNIYSARKLVISNLPFLFCLHMCFPNINTPRIHIVMHMSSPALDLAICWDNIYSARTLVISNLHVLLFLHMCCPIINTPIIHIVMHMSSPALDLAICWITFTLQGFLELTLIEFCFSCFCFIHSVASAYLPFFPFVNFNIEFPFSNFCLGSFR